MKPSQIRAQEVGDKVRVYMTQCALDNEVTAAQLVPPMAQTLAILVAAAHMEGSTLDEHAFVRSFVDEVAKSLAVMRMEAAKPAPSVQ